MIIMRFIKRLVAQRDSYPWESPHPTQFNLSQVGFEDTSLHRRKEGLWKYKKKVCMKVERLAPVWRKR